MHIGRRLALAACLAALAAAPAVAGTPEAAPATVSVPPGATALLSWKPKAWRPPYALVQAAMGMRVSRDPVTGLYEMPLDDAIGELARIGELAPVQVDLRADGSRRAHLDERFAEFAVVQLGPDGKPTWTCVHSKTAAEQFVNGPRQPVLLPMPGTTWEVK